MSLQELKEQAVQLSMSDRFCSKLFQYNKGKCSRGGHHASGSLFRNFR